MDELAELAQAFNRMASIMEQTEQRRLELIGNVAHELRTPLHIIQGNLEGVLDGVYEPTAPYPQYVDVRNWRIAAVNSVSAAFFRRYPEAPACSNCRR